MNFIKGLMFFAVASVSGITHAGLIGATVDLFADNGFRFSDGIAICKSAAIEGDTVGTGIELNSSDWSRDVCSGTYSVDITDQQILLTGLESGTYEYARFRLDVISGTTILAASFDGYTSNFLNPAGDFNDESFLPTVTFGADFVEIVWDTFGTGEFSFNGPGNFGVAPFGSAIFSVQTDRGTSNPVPTPSTILLCIFFSCLAGARGIKRYSISNQRFQ
ncbi:hypothetical protein PN836_007950 [Ningiella sp. W23]|uniref:hypothetical protein n=1 Tax=Ningiella sp. W23 TaxID=3023715 RepID=UPI003757BCEB